MKRSETKRLDKEWSYKVRSHFHFQCQVCGHVKNRNHAHHIIPKHANKDLRHDIRNGICLCFRCHKVGPLAAHQNALFFNKWLRKNHNAQWKWCMIKGGITNGRTETTE